MGVKWKNCVAFVGVLAFVFVSSTHASHSSPLSEENPQNFNRLQQVIRDVELSKAESLKNGEWKQVRKLPVVIKKEQKRPIISAKSSVAFRSDILRQELAKESKDNCLAKLICSPLTPPKNSTGPANAVLSDYGVLVKAFFDIFDLSDDPKEKVKPKEANDDETNQENDEEESDEDNARSDAVNVTASIIDDLEQEVTTSTISTVSSITTGATVTEILGTHPLENDGIENLVPKITLEEVIGDTNRKRRSRRSLPISFGKLKQGKYINRQLRRMQHARSESQKLKFAQKIASKIRQPKQCREFNRVATQILSTCPLTSEVIRYFNSNLQNGSQIAILKQDVNSTSGGLVVLNDLGGRPHAHFLDNSPLIANTYINTDLKNPSVGDRFPLEDIRHPIYELQYPQKFDAKRVSLTQEKKKKKQQKEQEIDEEDESGENDQDDEEEEVEEGDEEEADEDEADDNNNVQNEEHSGEDEGENEERGLILIKKYKRVKTQKKKKSKPKTLPKGMIKVYGVPQHSFDNEFNKISSQIGSGPVLLFDQDDFDAHIPHPGPPIRSPPPRPKPASSSSDSIKKVSNNKRKKPQIQEDTYKSSEEQEEPKRVIVSQNRPPQNFRRPYNFATGPYFGAFPAPRPEEYYHNGKPLKSRPLTPPHTHTMPMMYKPRPEIRSRLNFVHAPGHALMRPYAPIPYRRYGPAF